MDIFSMKCFLSAAETLNLSKAAEQMHITQPAMSIQIKKLEQEMGTALFERESRRMVLTPAGQLVQKNFQSMVESYTSMLWRLKSQQERQKSLRVGYHGPADWAGILDLFQRYLREDPETSLTLQNGEYGELAHQVEEGKLDAAILEATDFHEYDSMKWQSLFDDYGCFAMSKDHPLAGREKIYPQDLKDQKVYFNWRDSSSMQAIFRKLIQSGIEPDNLICVEGPITSITYALAYGGLAALPAAFKKLRGDNVAYVDQGNTIVHMRYGVAWRKDRETEALLRFVECCRQHPWPGTNTNGNH